MPRYIGRNVGVARMGKAKGPATQGVGLGPSLLTERQSLLRKIPKDTQIVVTVNCVIPNLSLNLTSGFCTKWLFVHLSVNCVLCFGVSTRTMFIVV